MFRLPPDADGRAPDDEGGQSWCLPTRLVPSLGPDGAPDVQLCRFDGGGSLRLRLRAETVAERPVPILGGRLRYVLSTPTGASAGQWHPIGPRTQDLVDVIVPLSPEESAVAQRVGEVGGPLVEVEVELNYLGRLPRLPWRASGDRAALRAGLQAVLGPAPWTVEAVEQALEVFDPAALQWSPSFAGAPPRNHSLAQPALGAALLEALFQQTPGGLTWVEAEPIVRLDLRVSRVAVRQWVRRWSFSAFFFSVADPSRHFINIDRPMPFQTRMLHVNCALPLGPDTVNSLTLEIDAGEITGLTTVSFHPGGPTVARVPFVHRSAAEPPRWKIRALVRGKDGLVVIDTEWKVADPLLVDLTPDATGIHPVRIEVNPDVWAYAAQVFVTVGSRTATLTPEQPSVWFMFRVPQASAKVRWVRADRTFEATLPLIEGRLQVSTAPLLPGQVVPVRLTPGPELLSAAAWVGIAQGDHVETLEPDGLTRLAVRRCLLDEPELRYRLVQLRRRPDGSVEPPETSEERLALGVQVVI